MEEIALVCRELLVECCLEALCVRDERVMREGEITADDTGNPRRRALHHGQCLSYALPQSVVLENSNVAKLASTQYLAVHTLPQEDCYDTDNASTGEI